VKLGIAALSLLSSPILYVHYIKTKDEQSLQDKITSKFIPNASMEEYVNRPELEGSLRAMIAPKKKVTAFYVVVGENGTGKTSAVQKVCEEIGNGIIYIDIPENMDRLAQTFANATGYVDRHHGGLANWIHSQVYGQEKKESNIKLFIFHI
jgi:hypothetical protein